MEVPAGLKYTSQHEWVKVEGDTVVVGITEFAQSELGEIVFVELPEIGNQCSQQETLCVVESTKAASDVYAPVSGKIKEVNKALVDTPDLVNSDPFNEGWMVKLEDVDKSEIESLLSPEQYKELIG